jgi:hypothetical protein
MDQIRPLRTGIDRWRWKPHAAGLFTVKTAYTALLNRTSVGDIQTNTAKASIFGWRLLIEKLPTNEGLYKRLVITNIQERSCVFCHNEVEDTNHIFFKCWGSDQVWRIIFNWMGTRCIEFVDVTKHFIHFSDLVTGNISKRLGHIIWLATKWGIWLKCNNILFRRDFINVSSLVEQIVYNAWFWFIGRSGRNVNVKFLDWCDNPLAYLYRI